MKESNQGITWPTLVGTTDLDSDIVGSWHEKQWVNGHWNVEFKTPDLLKFACPFCGAGDVRLLGQDESGPKMAHYCVACEACGASGPWTCSPHEAVARWNIRAR